MKCSNCDYSVKKDAIYCPNCGVKVTETNDVTKKTTKKNEEKEETVEVVENKDSGAAFAWGILGFFIPLVGLILFLVWREERPKDSKGAGIGALVRVILNLIAIFFLMFFIFLGFTSYQVYY